MKFIDTAGRGIGRTFYPGNHRHIKRILNFQNCVGHPSVMFRTETIKNLNGYIPFYDGAEDYELWTRIVQNFQIRNLKEPLTSYRISDFQMTKKLGARAQILSEIIRLKLNDTDLITTFPEEFVHDTSLESQTLKLEHLKVLLKRKKFGRKIHFNHKVTELIHTTNKTNLGSKFRLIGLGMAMFLSGPISTLMLCTYHFMSLLLGFFTAKIFACSSRKW